MRFNLNNRNWNRRTRYTRESFEVQKEEANIDKDIIMYNVYNHHPQQKNNGENAECKSNQNITNKNKKEKRQS